MDEDIIKKYENKVTLHKQEITVFIVTYNRENYLKLAIESILKQTYSNFTVIVLDNYSSDGTEQMINSIKDDRLLYIKHVSNLKTGDSNMRYGFQLCKTKYMVVFHDDDTIEPSFLEKGLDEIKKTDCVALSVGGRIIDEYGNYTGETWNSHSKMVFKKDEYFSFFFSHNADSMLYPSVIYRRDFFDDYKKFVTVMDVGPCNDQYLWFQICRYGGQICIDNLNLMNYRIHKNQDSQLNVGFMDYEFIDALNKIPYYKKLVDKYYKKIVVRIIRRYIQICEMFYSGKISRKRFSEVFNYNCINDLNDGCTKPLYFFIVLMFKNKMFSKFILRLEKRRLSIKNNEK